MAAFHVFVEGPTDNSPGALERLAAAIANHYGLGAADLQARLAKGRFRVKTNTDQETANTYARDLQRLGARCTIEEANPANSQRATPIPFPAVRPDTPPAGLPVAPPPAPLGAATALPAATGAKPAPATGLAAAGPRASTPPPVATASAPPATGLAAAGARASTPPPVAAAGSAGFQSGLSAAFSGEQPAADLGALGGGDAAFSLASLDGVDDNSGGAQPAGSFGPPDGGGLAASIGPAPDKPKKPAKAAAGKPDKPSDAPLDMFAPPEMQGEEFKVDIASDEQDISARKRASTPPPIEDSSSAEARPLSQRIPASRSSQPSMQVPNQPVAAATSVPSKFGPLGDPRTRFFAGLVLAVLLGFIPAHFIAKMQEDSADARIDNKVITAQQAADTPEVYAALDSMRNDQLARKKSEHRNAALIGFVVWALAGGGIAFAWFKKIPWDA